MVSTCADTGVPSVPLVSNEETLDSDSSAAENSVAAVADAKVSEGRVSENIAGFNVKGVLEPRGIDVDSLTENPVKETVITIQNVFTMASVI